ncbi:PucR family transcriptional regulator [Calidifontibacter sp. DB0510]|uniref:PucR family transcriptional regulator n=1 Tax=Metallococcus carri TaxID=1656884 RepID=A0A967AY26_9MICO|nr:helix-turn-helix domain-containing protein [Metallococcus carri]NHN54848.1 PucR family transcriptional regulator [Metallococcus carri]NOP37193.1 helix-turn-helix domain-containing protein [Calidifontibacter sp. DB2511S]
MRPLQQLIDHLASRLGSPLLVVGPVGELIVHSPHPPYDDPLAAETILRRTAPQALTSLLDNADTHDGRVRWLGHTSTGAARFALPLCHEALLCGYVIGTVADPAGATEGLPAIDTVRADAHELALGLIAFRKERATTRQEERRAMHDLLSRDAATRQDATLRIQEHRWIREAPVTAIVVSVVAPGLTHDDARIRVSLAIEDVRDQFPPREVMSLPGSAHGVLLLAPERPRGVDDAARVAFDRLTSEETRALIGVGTAVSGLAKAHLSYAEALRARRVASVEPSDGPRRFDDLGVYTLLTALPEEELETAVGPAIRRLIGYDEEQQSTLVSTLEAFLDLGGDARAAAEALYIHRATLYQRLRRIEQIVDADLADGRTRLTCHLGLKAARLLRGYAG